MKILLFIQRVLALGVICVGAVFAIGELDITASCAEQAALTIGGLVLAALGIGWLILTGLEEDWFVRDRKHAAR